MTLRHGTRAVLCFESELPVGECVAVRHAREISAALLSHAEREYLPVAAAELESLVGAGRAFAFSPHKLRFCARIAPAGAGLCLQLSLCYEAGGEVHLSQSAQSLWAAGGNVRCKKMPRVRKNKQDRGVRGCKKRESVL
ncbi:MAG: hypothetical protein J6U87_03300 [Clostridia bacterium]|nr:hypothetical protein [Clostridia bacterium]